jgi:hypothetical protein
LYILLLFSTVSHITPVNNTTSVPKPTSNLQMIWSCIYHSDFFSLFVIHNFIFYDSNFVEKIGGRFRWDTKT